MRLKSVWGHTARPWGYEVRVDVEHAGVVYNEELTFPTAPDQAGLDAAVGARLAVLSARVAAEAAAQREAAAVAEFESIVGLN